MNEMARVFGKLVGCPLWQAVRMASLTPAEFVGANRDIGTLALGKWADVILIDDAVRVHATYVGGCPTGNSPPA